MSGFSNHQVASGMRRLRGELSTPSGFPRDLRKYIVEQGYMRFLEWPSGHWSMTHKGRVFLSEQASEDGE